MSRIGAGKMGAMVKVAYCNNKVHVFETRARKDGSEIQGEVGMHGQRLQVGLGGDSAR